MDFLIESLKNFRTVGAVAACSSIAAGRMTRSVDFVRAAFIVELGGGTGAITKEILARLRPGAELVVFEIHPVFAQVLRKIDDARLTVVNDSAVRLGAYLKSRGRESADAIISTLPLATMSRNDRTRVLTEVSCALGPRGRYIQIQYSLLSKKEIERLFRSVAVSFTPFNLPPAFVYICER